MSNQRQVATPAPVDDDNRPSRRIGLRIGQVAAGVLVALVLAEVGFWWRDNGAFPHVNLYVEDAALGVRLEPGASQRLQFHGNPVTEIRVNRAGYRGADWGEANDDDILVVGDSQVFGLGVEEQETFSAQLAALTSRTVLNGGVPTYGPAEYTAVVKEVMAERKPTTVVYVVNFVNDLFETDRPNKDRHAVWDGWAVRSETAPGDVSRFPGRQWLFSQSHLVYAARRWLYEQGPTIDDRSFESEGTWTDLVAIGGAAHKEHADQQEAVHRANEDQAKRVEALRQEISEADSEIETALVENSQSPEEYFKVRAASGKPGDIVYENTGAEAARAVHLTARTIRKGVIYRNQLAAKLRKRSPKLDEVLNQRDTLVAEQGRLHSRTIEVVNVPSILEQRMQEVKKVCDDHGAELVVVALPIDVQVSSDEWKKYGVDDPPDMTGTTVLLSDLVATAEATGARAIDVTPALAAVDGPAFLHRDIHLTPAGHLAVARAVAAKLAEPAPLPQPEPGLPAGRTRMPAPETWRTTPEATVHGSTAAKCETMVVGEWFRATCLRVANNHVPTNIEVISGGHGEASVVRSNEAVTLVTPLFEGEEFAATFHWTTHRQEFIARWKKGRERPLMWFEDAVAATSSLELSDPEKRLCECHLETENEKKCEMLDGYPVGCVETCSSLYGDPSSECMETYGDDCKKLLACVRGEVSALPACPMGSANAGATGQCFALCSADRPCATGTCVPWQGTSICR